MNAAAADRARLRHAGSTAATALCALLVAAADAQQNPDLVLPPSADVDAATVPDGPAIDPPGAPAGASGSGNPGTAGDAAVRSGAAAGPAAVVGNDDGPAERNDSVARIAAPAQDAPVPMEEVIVVNESEWRLPDLGSEWRQAQTEEPDTGRIQLSFMPLYDPENADPVPDIFDRNSALHRMQMIELIRVRFGGRPQD